MVLWCTISNITQHTWSINFSFRFGSHWTFVFPIIHMFIGCFPFSLNTLCIYTNMCICVNWLLLFLFLRQVLKEKEWQLVWKSSWIKDMHFFFCCLGLGLYNTSKRVNIFFQLVLNIRVCVSLKMLNVFFSIKHMLHCY